MLNMLQAKLKRIKTTQETLTVSICRGEDYILCVNPHRICETNRTHFTDDSEKYKKGDYQAG